MPSLLIKNVALGDDPVPRDVVINEGVIAQIRTCEQQANEDPDSQYETIDGSGRCLVPSFVEPHLHLDKALLDARMPNLAGTLEGAITVTGALKAKFTHEDVVERASRVLDMAIVNGTTAIRCHPDVDPIAKLIGAEAMFELRERYEGRIDLQIVAFPQEGIIKAPGTYELLEECLRQGADVVGGCTYNEPTLEQCVEHVNKVFDLAEKYDVPVDMHADFQTDAQDPRYGMAATIADITIARGMQGRVTLGHMTSLGSLDAQQRISVWDKLKSAGIAIVPLPFTDMHLNARADDHNVRRGVAPIKIMWEVGVQVGLSSNNVRNAFTPFGNADLMDVALFAAQVCHMGSPSDFKRLMDTISNQNAAIIGIGETHGLAVGDRADLVLLDAADPATAMLDRAVRSAVIKDGRVVVRTSKTSELLITK